MRALYNHSFANGDIITLGGDYMCDYLMNTKLKGRTHTQHTADAFAQYDWNIDEQWEMVGALRYDYFSLGHLSRLTPKLSLRYQPRRNLSLRMGYGMGFRAPTLKERYYEFDMSGIWIVEGNEKLKSEVSHNINASVEYTKGRYNFMLMGYYNSVSDKISTGIPYYVAKGSTSVNQLRLPYTNLENYSVYGLDFSARGRWDWLSARLGYAYTKERLPKSDGLTINNQYIPARPHALNWQLGADKQLSDHCMLSVTLSGRLLSAVDNVEYRDYYNITLGTSTVHYPAYSLWKLMATTSLWQRVKVLVTIDNLFNYKPDYYYLNAPITDGTNLMIGMALDLW
jgi:outer membrane receptor for ferrienterochelin and colicins